MVPETPRVHLISLIQHDTTSPDPIHHSAIPSKTRSRFSVYPPTPIPRSTQHFSAQQVYSILLCRRSIAVDCSTPIIYNPFWYFQERRIRNACSHLHPKMTEQKNDSYVSITGVSILGIRGGIPCASLFYLIINLV